ncbi:MAG: TetR/AcrR family transcriptional regulator [Acidimicrobiales bacterium]
MAKAGAPSRLGGRGAPRSAETRRRLVAAAVETLKEEGYVGASARAIAERAGSTQGLIFYHFGSVTNLLLAALDSVSAERLEHYSAAVAGVTSPTELVEVATAIFREDLRAGYVTVLVEMIAGATSTPGLGPAVAARIGPWTEFTQRAIEGQWRGTPLAAVVPARDVAYGVVALYLGLEMLTHLDGDPSPALGLLAQARNLAGLVEAVSGPPPAAGAT